MMDMLLHSLVELSLPPVQLWGVIVRRRHHVPAQCLAHDSVTSLLTLLIFREASRRFSGAFSVQDVSRMF